MKYWKEYWDAFNCVMHKLRIGKLLANMRNQRLAEILSTLFFNDVLFHEKYAESWD